MSTTTTSSPVQDPNLKRLEERLLKLQKEIALHQQHAVSSTRLTLIVGVIAIIAIGGYFSYGYSQFAEITQPKRIIDIVQDMVDEKIPEARKAIEAEIQKNAPIWAANVSTQAQSSLPLVREKMEGFVMERVDGVLDHVAFMTEDEFRTYLKNNKETLEAGFKELGDNPKLAEESLASLEAALETQLQANMKEQAQDIFGTLVALNEKLLRLHAGKNLQNEEPMARRILSIARRLQIERADADSEMLKKRETPKSGDTAATETKDKSEETTKEAPAKEPGQKEAADSKKSNAPEEKKATAGDS